MQIMMLCEGAFYKTGSNQLRKSLENLGVDKTALKQISVFRSAIVKSVSNKKWLILLANYHKLWKNIILL